MWPSHVLLSGLCSGCPFLRPHLLLNLDFSSDHPLFQEHASLLFFKSTHSWCETLQPHLQSLVSYKFILTILVLAPNSNSWLSVHLFRRLLSSTASKNQRWSECLTKCRFLPYWIKMWFRNLHVLLASYIVLCALIYKNHWVSISKSHFGPWVNWHILYYFNNTSKP